VSTELRSLEPGCLATSQHQHRTYSPGPRRLRRNARASPTCCFVYDFFVHRGGHDLSGNPSPFRAALVSTTFRAGFFCAGFMGALTALARLLFFARGAWGCDSEPLCYGRLKKARRASEAQSQQAGCRQPSCATGLSQISSESEPRPFEGAKASFFPSPPGSATAPGPRALYA
jgi:hypothetical protein